MGDIADYHVDQFSSGRWGQPTNTYKGRNVNMENNITRVVTGEVRFSFVSLLSPREDQFGGKPKYSATILVPKSDVQTKQMIDAAIEAAKQKGKTSSWNGVIPPIVSTPVHDGDGVKPSDGSEFGPECKGHWVFTATTGVDYPPKVVGPDLSPIMDATEIYSGMYGRIAVNFSPYSFQGKKGVGVYISTNVQKTRDGEPLGASAPDAGSDFDSLAQTAPAQNFGGAPQQAPQHQPNYGQQQFQQPPVQQPNYGQQPAQQQQQYQPINPITGQPINNGGVYGI